MSGYVTVGDMALGEKPRKQKAAQHELMQRAVKLCVLKHKIVASLNILIKINEGEVGCRSPLFQLVVLGQ